ncbi:hypothetical protein PVBG_05742 [Plasmodium vivax Brazil I]|uniref:Uncharacterized protein n=1 Tax=Plasmodium vivax (strain Brazil I) TaxID=1033975 RepID=A0A0J9SL36_PLAV1|nr:hypothetical protein PVBG_05742 [Plasmodium vivax Brazil I]
MPDEKEFTLDKIKDNVQFYFFLKKLFTRNYLNFLLLIIFYDELIHILCYFMTNSKFYKIYDVFRKQCEYFMWDDDQSCYKDTLGEIENSLDVTEILKHLYSNLYRIYATIKYNDNTYFDYVETADYKLCYTSLKYWLYDQIIIKGLEERKINEIFKGWEYYIKIKITNKFSDSCAFNKLTLDEIKRLKNIYALYTVLYNNTTNFETCKGNRCKYLKYFGKGIGEFISSINSCSSNSYRTNYCVEFKEFVDLCKENNKDAGISIYEESKKGTADTAGKYLLSVKTYENEPHYI